MVDDTPDVRLLFEFLLESTGAHVSSAENGLAAWKVGRPFDLILMDLQMPVLDGWLATRRLRAAHYRGTIIAHSADTGKRPRRRIPLL